MEQIQIFENQKVRAAWNEAEEKWYFSIVDVCAVLTESMDPAKYWRVLKTRLKKEGNETATNCSALKMTAVDGKQRLTDVADMEQMFRIIQSIPSKKAEPFKMWLASVGAERIEQLQDPEKSIDQAIVDYRKLGYSEAWINQRIKTIEIRKHLTDEWKRGGVTKEVDFAFLTDIMSKTWSGLTTREYKKHKGLKGVSLRDNMTDVELMLNGLAEASAAAISQNENPEGISQAAGVAIRGASIARNARQNLEAELGHSVISKEKALSHISSEDELQLTEHSASDDGKETF